MKFGKLNQHISCSNFMNLRKFVTGYFGNGIICIMKTIPGSLNNVQKLKSKHEEKYLLFIITRWRIADALQSLLIETGQKQ